MFSRRLTWPTPPNALARLEADRRAAGAPLLDLTVTNPTLVDLPYPAQALAAALADPGLARYEPAPLGLPSARAALAAESTSAGRPVAPNDLVLTASSSESYAFLFKALCDPGDVVLVPEPSYPLFDYLARLDLARARPYRLVYDGGWQIDWSTFDAAGARAIVVVSPNNPTGSFISAGDLARLEALAARAGLALIVDEVFADYPLAPAPDAVRSVVGRDGPALTFALGGLSKGYGLPQLKLGWIALGGPAPLRHEARGRLELIADTYLSVGTPVQLALPALLPIGHGLRGAVASRVARNRAALARAAAGSPSVTLLAAEAGWTAILRLPAVRSDEEWALTLLGEDDLLVQPGYYFDLRLGACLVLSLLPPPAPFDEGVARLFARVRE